MAVLLFILLAVYIYIVSKTAHFGNTICGAYSDILVLIGVWVIVSLIAFVWQWRKAQFSRHASFAIHRGGTHPPRPWPTPANTSTHSAQSMADYSALPSSGANLSEWSGGGGDGQHASTSASTHTPGQQQHQHYHQQQQQQQQQQQHGESNMHTPPPGMRTQDSRDSSFMVRTYHDDHDELVDGCGLPAKCVCATRVCCGAVSVLLSLLTFTLFFLYLYFTTGQSGPFVVPGTTGLLGSFTVETEQSGVVHITADHDLDVYFAQGMVTARARLWQMEFQRRVGAGRLAEVVGKQGLVTDKQMRVLGVYAAAQRTYDDALSQEVKEIIDAYTAGVNAYLTSHPRLPIEFILLGHTPEPWKPADSLVRVYGLGCTVRGGVLGGLIGVAVWSGVWGWWLGWHI